MSSSKFLSFLALSLLAPIAGSRAANSPVKVEDLAGPQSAEQILQRMIREKKRPAAQSIRRAYEAINAARFGTVAGLLSNVKADALLGDYYFGLVGESSLRAARGKLRRKSGVAAEADARRGHEMFLEIEARFPDSRFRKQVPEKLAWAEFMLADVAVAKKSWKEAVRLYQTGLARVNTDKTLFYFSQRSAEGLTRACVKSRDLTCGAWVRRLQDLFPKQSLVTAAILKNLPENFEINRVEKSERAYERLTMSYKAPDADQGAIDEAVRLYLMQEKGKAEDKLKEFLELYPRSASRSRARYWLAQIRSKEGRKQTDETNALYADILRESPTSFYGLLAGLATGKGLESAVEPSVAVARPDEKALDAKEILALQKAEALYRSGAAEGARDELTAIAPRAMHSSEFLIYLLSLSHEVGNDLHVFQIVNELIQRKHPGVYSNSVIQRIFPIRYSEEIERQAQATSLDPLVVLSLIKQESGFNAEIVSSAGALGLMQLMPFTAVEVDSTLEISEVIERPNNIRLGTKYLAGLLKRFNGNWVYALAGYNAGPHRVDQWRREAKPEWGMLEFIESIPYRETRDYVSSIIRHYVWYSFLSQGRKVQSLEYFWHPQGPPEPGASSGAKGWEGREYPRLSRKPAAKR